MAGRFGKNMTIPELIERLRDGSRLRWVPAHVIGNESRGLVPRNLYLDSEMVSDELARNVIREAQDGRLIEEDDEHIDDMIIVRLP